VKQCLLFNTFLFFHFIILHAQIEGKITSVKDGDTYMIKSLIKEYTVRLNAIDAPERDQDFGDESKVAASEFEGKEVLLDSLTTDKYGRTVGKITIKGKGIDLSTYMVSNGFAWHYKKYSSDTILAQLEIVAREKKLGLWHTPNAMAPWDWRNFKRSDPIKKDTINGEIRNSYKKQPKCYLCISKYPLILHSDYNCCCTHCRKDKVLTLNYNEAVKAMPKKCKQCFKKETQ
jgi:micrococcal nuclease